MTSSHNQRTGQTATQSGIVTNISSQAFNVDGYRKVTVEDTLTVGAGNATFKYQVAYQPGGTKHDLLLSGVATVTRTAAGVGVNDLYIGNAVELYITAIDITTGGYTLDVSVQPYSDSV